MNCEMNSRNQYLLKIRQSTTEILCLIMTFKTIETERSDNGENRYCLNQKTITRVSRLRFALRVNELFLKKNICCKMNVQEKRDKFDISEQDKRRNKKYWF